MNSSKRSSRKSRNISRNKSSFHRSLRGPCFCRLSPLLKNNNLNDAQVRDKMVDRGTLDINKDLSFVDPRIRSQAPVDRMILLPHGFTPTNWDGKSIGFGGSLLHLITSFRSDDVS